MKICKITKGNFALENTRDIRPHENNLRFHIKICGSHKSVVRRPKKGLISMKSCKIYVKLSIVSRNPKENLIYLNISDCSSDEMQSQINTMRILMILKLYLNKNFHVTEYLLFASERARSADSGAIFAFKIQER